MELYHGSNVIVQKPKIVTNGFYKDFGYGFYCTNIESKRKDGQLQNEITI